MRILITAGPTREYIDTVRYLSNASSGKMGFAIAAAARRRGHAVTLIHGPVELRADRGIVVVPVVSAADMLAACRAAWPKHDLLIMAAAVADYTPAARLDHKLKKRTRSLRLQMRPTVDILAALARGRRPDQRVIGFALEDRRPRAAATEKLERKRLNAIILNRPSAIGADTTGLEVLTTGGKWMEWPEASKRSAANRIVRLGESLFAPSS